MMMFIQMQHSCNRVCLPWNRDYFCRLIIKSILTRYQNFDETFLIQTDVQKCSKIIFQIWKHYEIKSIQSLLPFLWSIWQMIFFTLMVRMIQNADIWLIGKDATTNRTQEIQGLDWIILARKSHILLSKW